MSALPGRHRLLAHISGIACRLKWRKLVQTFPMKPYLGICLVLLTLTAACLVLMRACTNEAQATVQQVVAAFSNAMHLQPQVKVNERVILTQTSPIAELAVVTKDELVSVSLDEHFALLTVPVPLTENKVTAEAVYRLKAGFDLKEPFSVTINPATRMVRAAMPRAKILSVEQVGQVTLHGDDAWLNRVTPDETEEALNDLTAAAREAAENSDLKKQAELQVSTRLNQLMQRNGQTFLIDWEGVGNGGK